MAGKKKIKAVIEKVTVIAQEIIEKTSIEGCGSFVVVDGEVRIIRLTGPGATSTKEVPLTPELETILLK